MRKFLTLMIAAALLIIGSTYLASRAAPSQQPVLKRNGAVNPQAIPDAVAYEFFFKSLISSPAEGAQGQNRAKAFALQTGLDDNDAEWLLQDAQKVYQEISKLDRQVKEIKDRTWPNPAAKVWSDLRALQRQKDAVILEQVQSLFAERNPKMTARLQEFVTTEVKSKIKGFADRPNHGQQLRPSSRTVGVTLATFFWLSLTNLWQMQGDETVWIYANAYRSGEYVYGGGWVEASASSYGHEYSARTELYGPCGQVEIGTGTNFAPLYYNGSWCDGLFAFYTTAIQACPISNNFHDAGVNEDTETVQPFFILGEFGAFSRSSISTASTCPTGCSNISIDVSASSGMPIPNSVTISLGPQSVSGSVQFSVQTTANGQSVTNQSMVLENIAPNGSTTVTGRFDATGITGSQATYRAAAMLGSANPNSIQAPVSKNSGSHTLTITP